MSQGAGGIAQLSGAVDLLNSGSTTLTNGLASLNLGIYDLATGSATIKNGISDARNGASDLLSGIEKIKKGQSDLSGGLLDAFDGARELSDKLLDATNKSSEKLQESKNKIQEEVMSAPVAIHDISIDIVNNNGTGFAPYFIPLAFWVGAMAIFFLVDLELPKKKKMRPLFSKIGISAFVSLLQAGTLDFVMIYCLGLKVNDMSGFIVFTILLSMMSMAIQMFLTITMGLAGKFVGIILLMLQLTSSGGSYPLETSPVFFRTISKYLPMTYAVSVLREFISGDGKYNLMGDIKMIVLFGSISLVLVLFYVMKPYKIVLRKNKKHAKNHK
ncbi:MAG: ABC transporter permease [Bacteroidales bacterium]|nr:ABC transporter permease [Bacteroidales bacterium]